MLHIADSAQTEYSTFHCPCVSRKGPFSMTKLKAGISATYPPTQLLTISRKELHHF